MSQRVPAPDELSLPFWDATRERRFALQWCRDCTKPIWYPRYICPRCGSDRLEWRDASGRGVVHSSTVVYAPVAPWRTDGPYVVALVDLDEGVRVMANIVGDDATASAIGDRVELAWEPLDDGRNLVQFRRGAG